MTDAADDEEIPQQRQPELVVRGRKSMAPLARDLVGRAARLGVAARFEQSAKRRGDETLLKARDFHEAPSLLKPLCPLLRPLRHRRIADPSLPQGEVSLELAGPGDAFDVEVLVRCPVESVGRRIVDDLKQVGFQDVRFVAAAGVCGDEVVARDVARVACDAAKLVLADAGGVFDMESDASMAPIADGMLLINALSPALPDLVGAVKVEIDDPSAVVAVNAIFRRAGFTKFDCGLAPLGRLERATIDPGGLTAAGETGVIAKLWVAAEEALPTRDVAQFPLQEVGPNAGAPVVRLPIMALKTGSLEPYAGDAPARFKVCVRTDDRALGLKLSASLKAKGFKRLTKRRIHERTDCGFQIRASRETLRRAGVTELVREALEEVMLQAPAAAALPIAFEQIDGEGVEVFAPFEAAASGLLAEEMDDPGRFDVIICAETPEAERMARALRDIGFKRIRVEPEAAETDRIEHRGASSRLIASIRRHLAKQVGKPMLSPRRDLTAGEPQIRIRMSERSALRARVGAPPRRAASSLNKQGELAMPTAFFETEPTEGVDHAFIEIAGDAVRIGRTVLPRRAGDGAGAPPCPPGFTIDPKTARILEYAAIGYGMGEAVLIEGETGASKTSSIQYLAHVLNCPMSRLNLTNQTEVQDLLGRFEPGEPAGWRWRDGPLPTEMARGGVLLLDEINLASTQVIERLNSALEKPPSLTLVEHRAERIEAQPGFFVAATCNPLTYEGRQALSAALSNRLACLRVERPSAADQAAYLRRSLFGRAPVINVDGVVYGGPAVEPLFPALGAHPAMAELVDHLASFHVEVEAAAAQAHHAGAAASWSGAGGVAFSRRQLIDTVRFLEKEVSEGGVLQTALERAVHRYYCARLSEEAAATVRDIAAANSLSERRAVAS